MDWPRPVEGERVLFCEHADVDEFHIDISANACPAQPFHWYWLGAMDQRATRNDGEEFPVRWLAICDDCQKRVNTFGAIADAARQDAPWIGAAPNITVTV